MRDKTETKNDKRLANVMVNSKGVRIWKCPHCQAEIKPFDHNISSHMSRQHTPGSSHGQNKAKRYPIKCWEGGCTKEGLDCFNNLLDHFRKHHGHTGFSHNMRTRYFIEVAAQAPQSVVQESESVAQESESIVQQPESMFQGPESMDQQFRNGASNTDRYQFFEPKSQEEGMPAKCWFCGEGGITTLKAFLEHYRAANHTGLEDGNSDDMSEEVWEAMQKRAKEDTEMAGDIHMEGEFQMPGNTPMRGWEAMQQSAQGGYQMPRNTPMSRWEFMQESAQGSYEMPEDSPMGWVAPQQSTQGGYHMPGGYQMSGWEVMQESAQRGYQLPGNTPTSEWDAPQESTQGGYQMPEDSQMPGRFTGGRK
jgi:hypothetical protein